MVETKNPLQSIDLGWRARTRPASGFAHVLAAGAGAFAVFAVVELIVKITSDNARLPGIALSLALAAAAFAAGMFMPGPVRSFGTVVLVLTTPLIWYYAFYGGHEIDQGLLRGVLLLSAALYLVFYALQWTRGRAVFLAFSLLSVVAYLEFEVSRQFESGSSATLIPIPIFLVQFLINPFLGSGVPFLGSGLNPSGPSSLLSSEVFRAGNITATVALVLGVLFIVAAGVLIRRGYTGAATPFLVVGAIQGFVAPIALGRNEGSVLLTGLLIAAVGALLGLAATGNARRGGVWIGVVATVLGILAVLADATTDELGRAGYSALAAVGLLFISLLITHRLREAPDNEVGTR